MGPRHERARELDARHHMSTYSRQPVMFVEGRGVHLYDDDGREYLDFVSGIGAVNLGHAHPLVAEAVSRQMRRLVHVTNLYQVEHRAELAEDLSSLLGGDFQAFFCNSGAEACEGAIKLSRIWGRKHKGPDAVRVITAERSFHGRTLAALAATGQPLKQEAFKPLPPGFSHVPFGDIAALQNVVDDTVCAVMLEVVQGEGGVHPCGGEYLEAVRELCDERGALLVLDEVQSGFWRTGPAFAHQAYDVRPDVVALAKAMANGLPAGAVMARTAVSQAFSPGDHGSTFGGGPVVCAAARATIATAVAEDIGENVFRVGAHLRRRLDALGATNGIVAEVRGSGLMAAIELTDSRAPTVASMALGRGVVLNAIGERIIRFLPPLICTSKDVDVMIEVLSAVLGEVDT